MLIVQLCDFGDDGDAEYRLHQPSRHLGAIEGVTVIDCHFAHRSVPELALLADVLVIQFFNDWDVLSLCDQRRRSGKVTVFEANDYFFDLPAWSPVAEHWRDRAIQQLYGELLRAADGVQTSSQALAAHWRARGARAVEVFDNQLESLDPLPAPPTRPFTIGWAGSPGHFADWFAVAPALSSWLRARPEVHLAVMTNGLAKDFFDLPPSRYRFTEFGSLRDYLGFLRGLDVGIAPLLPTEYNKGRSDVKFLEYASQGVVGIYSDLDPYQRVVVHGRTGMSYQTPDQLIEALDQLYVDTDLRQQIREQAYQYVADERMIVDRVGDRLRWYRELATATGAGEGASPTPNSVSSIEVCAEGYQQLRLGEPELALQATLTNPSAPASIDARRKLVAQQPTYLALLQSQAKLLNDSGQHAAAMQCLQQARSLAPDSAKTWSEIGRAHLLLGELVQAREVLGHALRLSPQYLPGWQYLLRFNVITHSQDAVQCADTAIELFPTCYPVALLAIEAYQPVAAVAALRELLERVEPTLTVIERPVAMPVLSEAVIAAARAAEYGVEAISLLRQACEMFPESARLAGECGQALFRAADPDLGNRYLARAASLRIQADAVGKEVGATDQIPWTWMFAHHIETAGDTDSQNRS